MRVVWSAPAKYLELRKAESPNDLLYPVVLLVLELNPIVLFWALLFELCLIFWNDSFVFERPYTWFTSISFAWEVCLTGVLIGYDVVNWQLADSIPSEILLILLFRSMPSFVDGLLIVSIDFSTSLSLLKFFKILLLFMLKLEPK